MPKERNTWKWHARAAALPKEIRKRCVVWDWVREPNTQLKKTARKTFQILFYLHLLLITILIIVLTVLGLLFANTHHFHPIHWYPPLLTSSACAAIAAFGWQAATRCNPSNTIKAAFWLSPSLTCATGVLLLSIGSAGSLVAAAMALIFALIQSLYACWVVPRFDYAARILKVSLSSPAATGATNFVLVSVIVGTTYSCFCVSGIGGAISTITHLDGLFISVILLSLAWTMHVIRNISHVAISRVGYMHFANEMEVGTRVAFCDTIKHSMECVCLSSALVPILGVIRGSARAMSSIAGDTDEFMFSCADCYARVADRLVAYGHKWGFVHVGVYDKGFVRASVDTWEMFQRVRMESLIDSDLTGSFCFLSSVAVGAICTLIGGSWTFAVHKSYATEVSIYAFLIGYFIGRIAMALPQACVSAYHVAYAENPENLRFDSTIPTRIQELQRSQALSRN
ncbi:hypothetical protein HHK36_011566 [Tetracentron sinense]|uniref:Choline transporter-like protein n=1 Tax=Tetracentron sinense TaxID=13715 RepID=A0A834ZIU8_TETSI|nr:hypothetical protein HHK36_011566 [Tetracentron sinense]